MGVSTDCVASRLYGRGVVRAPTKSIMGRRSRRLKAPSRKGRIGVAKAEIDLTKPTVTKEPIGTVVSPTGEIDQHVNPD